MQNICLGSRNIIIQWLSNKDPNVPAKDKPEQCTVRVRKIIPSRGGMKNTFFTFPSIDKFKFPIRLYQCVQSQGESVQSQGELYMQRLLHQGQPRQADPHGAG